MISTASDAYRLLAEMAGRGREYVIREVLTKFTGDPEAAFGCGFDEDQPVPVMGSAEDQQLKGLAGIRVIRTPDDLLVRVRVTWESDYGAHASVMSCRLTADAAGRLDDHGQRDAETVDRLLNMILAPDVRSVDPMLLAIFAMAKPYQAGWIQDFPGKGLTNAPWADAVAEYHQRAVTQLRGDQLRMLGLLSPTPLDAGRLAPADLIGLCSWLRDKRPVTSAV